MSKETDDKVTKDVPETSENNQKNTQSTDKEVQKKVMERVSEKVQEKQDEADANFKFLMIGGNMPELSEQIMKVVEKQKEEVVLFELSHNEMSFITKSRSEKRAEESAVDFLKDPKNIAHAKQQCIEIKKIYFGEKYEEIVTGWIDKRRLKKKVNASWKQLDELLSHLDLFGMVTWDEDDKHLFDVTIDPEIIVSNKVNELEQLLNLAKGKVLALYDHREDMSDEAKKTLTSLKRKFNTDREWNLKH